MDNLSYDDLDCLADAFADDIDCLTTLRSTDIVEVLEGEDGPACHIDLMYWFWRSMVDLGLCQDTDSEFSLNYIDNAPLGGDTEEVS